MVFVPGRAELRLSGIFPGTRAGADPAHIPACQACRCGPQAIGAALQRHLANPDPAKGPPDLGPPLSVQAKAKMQWIKDHICFCIRALMTCARAKCGPLRSLCCQREWIGEGHQRKQTRTHGHRKTPPVIPVAPVVPAGYPFTNTASECGRLITRNGSCSLCHRSRQASHQNQPAQGPGGATMARIRL